MNSLIFAVVIVFSGLFLIAASQRNFSLIMQNNDERDYCHQCNVILISIDTLRADHLTSYGYFRNVSPNIDKIAENGVLFENTYSTASWTLPSHMSIFTGVYPNMHGVKDLYISLPENIKTLFQYLKTENYTTVWVAPSDSEVLNLSLGFGRGIDYTIDENNNPGVVNFTEPSEWVLDNLNSKFFMFLHTFVVHEPNVLVNGEKAQFYPDYNGTLLDTLQKLNDARFQRIRAAIKQDPQTIDEIFGMENVDKLNGLINGQFTYEKWSEVISLVRPQGRETFNSKYRYWVTPYRNSFNVSNSSDLNYLGALYDQSILRTDGEFGKFIDVLNRSSLLNKTIIIIVSDHGEEIGDHNNFGHYPNSVHEELVHVPLIIYYPKNIHAKRISAMTSTVDILPTILDMVGINLSASVHGKSLLPLISGSETQVHQYVFGFTSEAEFVRNESWSLIVYPNNTQELYFVEKDRKEQSNLILTKIDVAEQLRKIIDTFQANEGENFVTTAENATQKLRQSGYI